MSHYTQTSLNRHTGTRITTLMQQNHAFVNQLSAECNVQGPLTLRSMASTNLAGIMAGRAWQVFMVIYA